MKAFVTVTMPPRRLIPALLLGLLAACGGGSDGPSGPLAFKPDPARAMEDITTLASSRFEGRQGGLPGAEMTAELVNSRFAQLGLKPAASASSFLQSFPLDVWNQTTPTVFSIGGTAMTEGVDYMLLMYTDPASVKGELVFAGYGITVPPFSKDRNPTCPLDASGYDDYAGIDVTDKVVVVFGSNPGSDSSDCPTAIAGQSGTALNSWALSYKSDNARAHGAKALIYLTPYSSPQSIIMFGYEANEKRNIATLETDRDALSRFLPNLKSWLQQIDTTHRPASRMTGLQANVEAGSYRAKGSASNVIGVIPGNDPKLKDEVVIIGAHLDHMGKRPNGDLYAGADDNASGLSVMLELARAAKESGLKPARTLMFAAYNAEELGLFGSCYYVKTKPLYPLASTKVMISVDMVGLGKGTGLDLYGTTDKDKSWIANVMAGASAAMGMRYTVTSVDPLLASDHACFAEAGIPAVMAFSTAFADHNRYHTPKDTAAAISTAALKSSLDLMWAFIIPVAEGTESRFQTAGIGIEPRKLDELRIRSQPLFMGR
ncbi:MAG: M20/M25/M40 family metallo-hydrolase [Rhodoferax sp.]